MPKRQLKGTVVSKKQDKTAIVQVERIKDHPKYRRRFKVHKNYKAHDENNECKEGDAVVIEETKPISKDKTFKFIRKI